MDKQKYTLQEFGHRFRCYKDNNIALNSAFYELIHSRIAGFCRNSGIRLFTVDGT